MARQLVGLEVLSHQITMRKGPTFCEFGLRKVFREGED